jgi:alkylated DNA repair dioxygenase AlkB
MAKPIRIVDGECHLIPEFAAPSSGYLLLEQLINRVTWEQEVILMFDKTHNSPRLSAWFGETGTVYKYSGITRVAREWPDYLDEIRQKIEEYTEQKFNSVLLNYYRAGSDGMGKHSDDEKELGRKPVIASLSLGATRRFILHPKSARQGKSISVNLPHGSLMVMSGNCQKNWKHSVPKTKTPIGPRINLTFRKIYNLK